ncbi:MAG TPA: zinc-dependent metalloprotease family protein [Pyrinomonadaceae bacterium]|nr:zinc-dependent metalloprotease family protein [Pyrinomonadaceae bacterium]
MKLRRSQRHVLLGALIALLVLWGMMLRPSPTSSQTISGGIWQDVAESSIVQTGQRVIVPAAYRTVRLDKSALTQLLNQAPLEFTAAAKQTQTILSVPMPDGKTSRFRIENSPIMEPGLAARYPEWKTFRGQGIDDPTATARFGLTSAGFHGIILSAGDTIYLDPYARGNTVNHISYFKHNMRGDKRFECHFGDLSNKSGTSAAPDDGTDATLAAAGVQQAGTLRTYRLALAVTGEYVDRFAPLTDLDTDEVRKDKAFAAMVATMNRVNGVYERELSVRMVFVNNERNLIFTNQVADPYSNNPLGIDMLVENQVACDALIGEENYDIGHVMSTGFGGVAFLEAVCNKGEIGVPADGSNAGGFTGLDDPVGDGFDIDFVAHEMGHQFGGNHTFNGADGSCGGNEGAESAYEPGSGTTIQAYAGICGTQDLQPHSDDYFHVKSLEEMVAFTHGGANGCSTRTAVDNAAPTVDAGADYNIPANTPFMLTAKGADPNGDPLTYTWEEYDLGPSAAAGGTNDNDNDNQARPIFRSYKGTTNPTRTFPSLKYILNNANTPPVNYDCGRGTADPCITGEDLPSMTRTMKFQVVARDNRAVGGGINADMMQVNVSGTAGPFVVTGPNASASLMGRAPQTVKWDVAKTNLAPINAANVKISFSADGGNTFPYVLVASTPNDGSESVAIPNVDTTKGRIKVEAVGNIFFDISNADLTVTHTDPSLSNFLLSMTSAPMTINSCGTYTGRVTVDAPALAGGTLVRLTNNNPAASLPPSVLVPAGKTSATFQFSAKGVTTAVTGTVVASGGGTTISRQLTVNSPKASLVVLSPNPIKGGKVATGTVLLQCAAPAGGLPVTLSTTNALVASPASTKFVIPAGTTRGTFTTSTKAVTATKSVYIGATAGGTKVQTRLVVDP